MGWSTAAVLALALGALALVHFREKPPETLILRTNILPPEKTSFDSLANNLAVSPDGRRLVFTPTATDGKRQLWVRRLDALAAQPLAGTDDGTFPFWSPDNRSIGFFADGKLKKIDTTGGPAVTLADAPTGRSGSWSTEDVIVFALQNGPLLRVPASGGASSPTTKPAEGIFHAFPWFLPDGRHFLYMAANITAGDLSIQIASLDSPADKFLMQTNSNAVYSQGHLLFLRENTLMAQPFDVERLATTGEVIPIAEQVQRNFGNFYGVFSASSQGLLAYQSDEAIGGRKLTWYDRSGSPVGTLDQARDFRWTNFSPDRKRLATSIVGPAFPVTEDVWIYDVTRGLPTRFTFGTGAPRAPHWSPDGKTIIFSSRRKGHFDLYRKPADGSGNEELLYEDDRDKLAASWSPDGKFLLYETQGATRTDIMVLPLTGERKPFPFVQTPFNVRRPKFSPDGRWIAYQSDESGRFEIYVAAFPGPGGKRQISTAGGINPRWRQDGKEIFYIAPDRRLMAEEVNGGGNSLEVGRVVSLPVGPIFVGTGIQYDVSADGQRFLVAAPEQGASPPLTLVQNWTAGLKK